VCEKNIKGRFAWDCGPKKQKGKPSDTSSMRSPANQETGNCDNASVFKDQKRVGEGPDPANHTKPRHRVKRRESEQATTSRVENPKPQSGGATNKPGTLVKGMGGKMRANRGIVYLQCCNWDILA